MYVGSVPLVVEEHFFQLLSKKCLEQEEPRPSGLFGVKWVSRPFFGILKLETFQSNTTYPFGLWWLASDFALIIIPGKAKVVDRSLTTR